MALIGSISQLQVSQLVVLVRTAGERMRTPGWKNSAPSTTRSHSGLSSRVWKLQIFSIPETVKSHSRPTGTPWPSSAPAPEIPVDSCVHSAWKTEHDTTSILPKDKQEGENKNQELWALPWSCTKPQAHFREHCHRTTRNHKTTTSSSGLCPDPCTKSQEYFGTTS